MSPPSSSHEHRRRHHSRSAYEKGTGATVVVLDDDDQPTSVPSPPSSTVTVLLADDELRPSKEQATADDSKMAISPNRGMERDLIQELYRRKDDNDDSPMRTSDSSRSPSPESLTRGVAPCGHDNTALSDSEVPSPDRVRSFFSAFGTVRRVRVFLSRRHPYHIGRSVSELNLAVHKMISHSYQRVAAPHSLVATVLGRLGLRSTIENGSDGTKEPLSLLDEVCMHGVPVARSLCVALMRDFELHFRRIPLAVFAQLILDAPGSLCFDVAVQFATGDSLQRAWRALSGHALYHTGLRAISRCEVVVDTSSFFDDRAAAHRLQQLAARCELMSVRSLWFQEAHALPRTVLLRRETRRLRVEARRARKANKAQARAAMRLEDAHAAALRLVCRST